MRNVSAVDSSVSEEAWLSLCVLLGFFVFSLPFEKGQKGLPYLP